MPPAQFDLARCVSCGQVFRWERADARRWIGVDGARWFEVEIDRERHHVRSNAEPQAFRDLFQLDRDLGEIERRVLAAGPELAPYVGSLRGLRQMRPSCPREVLFSFLCTANNNLARIGPMVRHLAACGEPLAEVDGRIYRRFPPFERLAALEEEALRAAGFGYRARSIPAVAREILARGDAWWQGLNTLPYEDLHAELVSLPSVGPKLADCVALFGFHCDEAAPMDTHLWQACCRHYFPEWKGKPLTEHRYRVVADFLRTRFGPLTGWAHQYLFYDNLLNWRSRRSV